jgi:TonB family protein
MQKLALNTKRSSFGWLGSIAIHAAIVVAFSFVTLPTLETKHDLPIPDVTALAVPIAPPRLMAETVQVPDPLSAELPPPDWKQIQDEETPMEVVETLADVDDRSHPLLTNFREPEGGNGDEILQHTPLKIETLKLKRSTVVAQLANANPGGSGNGGDGGMIGTGSSGSGGGNGSGFGAGQGDGDGNGAGASTQKVGASTGSGIGNGAGNKAGDGKGGTTRNARAKHLKQGSYPSDARRAGVEGKVVLRLEVLASGRVGKVEVAASSGHSSLDNSAAEAAHDWTFYPAEVNGVAVTQWVQKSYSFRLTSR